MKIFMFAKCLNMMKNENVLLDPNSEALWGWAVGILHKLTEVLRPSTT